MVRRLRIAAVLAVVVVITVILAAVFLLPREELEWSARDKNKIAVIEVMGGDKSE